jgi:uncharacterized protein YjbJ (UPF0337 family)
MPVNQQVLEGDWDQLKGKVRQRWGQLSDHELEQCRGNVEQLVGRIEERTGESRADVEAYLQAAADEGAGIAAQAADAVVEQANQAAETAQQAAARVADSARAGRIQTERLIRNRPVESLAVCFGVGLVTGVVVGLLARSK